MKNHTLALAAAGALLLHSAAFASIPATAPYLTDPQSTHVQDATSESIGTVNMIMCYLHSTAADQLVNKGNYIAYADQNKCDKSAQASAANSGSSGGGAQAPNYMTAVVDSTRATSADPMRVKIWFEDTGDPAQKRTIFLNVSATQAPSASNPYGIFRLDFCGRGNLSLPCEMQGYLQGSQDGSLSFYQTEAAHNGSSGTATTALALTPNGTDKGSGSVQRSTGGVQNGFTFAYDPNLYLRGDGTTQQCFSRDAADPATGQSVWRYGLYDSTSGEHFDRNSGFPIEFSAGGTTYNGFLSYWGLSLPPAAAAALSNGMTVSKVDYNGNSAPTRTNYAIVLSSGKLTKYTKQSRTLQSLDQIRFNIWVGNEAAGFFAGAAPNTNYELYWDDASGAFKVTGQLNCGNNGCETHSFAADQVQSVGISFWSSQAGVAGWSNSLGGELFIDLKGVTDPVQSAGVNVLYRVQNLVYPSDYPAALFCVRDCPTNASMSGYFAPGSAAASPFAGASFNNWNPTAVADVVAYTPSAVDAVLDDAAGQPVVFTDANALAASAQYQNGLRSGRLVSDLAVAECAPGTGQYCDYQVQNADAYYVWETGANPWNHFAAVKDASGAFVAFDPPLNVNFNVPPDAVKYGAYAGKTLVLQYGGFGQLWGIPGVCVSSDSNATVSCDTPNSRFVPQFVIPYDAALGVVTSSTSAGTSSYLVKWLDREIRFAAKDPSLCAQANLVLPASVALPSAAGLQDPSDPAAAIYIGAEPVVTDPVRVIQGDVKW